VAIYVSLVGLSDYASLVFNHFLVTSLCSLLRQWPFVCTFTL